MLGGDDGLQLGGAQTGVDVVQLAVRGRIAVHAVIPHLACAIESEGRERRQRKGLRARGVATKENGKQSRKTSI